MSFKVIDGNIFMGDTPIFGHCCTTLAEKQAYCDTMNTEMGVDPEIEEMMATRDKRMAELPAEAKKRILDLLRAD